MSMSVTRKLICSTGQLVRSRARFNGSISSGHGALRAATSKSMTRSLWHMCRADDIYNRKFPASGVGNCRAIHTQGDKELSDFLVEEIAGEKKSAKQPADSVKGFKVVTLKGGDVELHKKQENETVTVKFNVTGSVDDEVSEEQMESGSPPQMVSRPPFVVEINKGGDTTLALQCNFPPVGDEIKTNPEDQQQYEDLIEILEVALLKGEKWEDSTYCVNGASLDGNLYDMLLNMLEERGIDGPFVDQFVQYATAHEHTKYLGFLEGLKDFANSK